MRAFEHVDVFTLAEAVELLGFDPEARLIAGGTDLIPEMRLGIRAPDRLINLKTVPGCDRISVQDNFLRIGALARLEDVAAHPLVRSNASVLAEAIEQSASPQIRSAATLGGSLCQESRCWYFRGPFRCWLKGGEHCPAESGDNRQHAILGGGPCFSVHPSDPATSLVALNARAAIVGPDGERTISIDQFFTRPVDGHRSLTCLRQDEILSLVEIPLPTAEERGVFLKAMDRADFAFALASVACVISVHSGRVGSASIVLGGVAPVPWRAPAAQRELLGRPLDRQTIARASAAATDGARPLSMNGYKVRLSQALVKRALEQVASLAG